eukprot:COSAG03_NODE_38_length_17530_cov_148.572223_4_plen_64_part_00
MGTRRGCCCACLAQGGRFSRTSAFRHVCNATENVSHGDTGEYLRKTLDESSHDWVHRQLSVRT